MDKIALVTDSACDLDEEAIKKFHANVLPFRIIYKDREYRDKVDISPSDVYRNMKNEIPKSSLPTMGDMEVLFQKLEADCYTHVIAVLLSTGLSGVYNAFKIVSEHHKNLITHICDSKSISLGERFILEECGKLINKGKKFKEIVDCLPVIKSKQHLFFIVDTLEYLIKGGRIGLVSGKIGELLHIKPIISVNSDGKYYTYAKVRGRNQSLNQIVEIGKELLRHHKCDIYIAHGDAPEDANKVYEMLSKLSNIGFLSVIGQISAVSGVHTGPGLVGVCFKECCEYE